jgi:hypothetical protein
MKEMESGNFKYTQKEMMIGNKRRTMIIIDKKPGAKLSNGTSPFVKMKQANTTVTKTVKRGKCGGCSRKRRG